MAVHADGNVVRQGSRLSSCVTYPMRHDRPGLSAFGSFSGDVSDLNFTSPPFATSICAIIFSSVVLPAPDGPMIVRNSPSATEKLRS